MGMLGTLSSSLTPGAKVTLLKECGGEKPNSATTVWLLGTREVSEPEPDCCEGAGGEGQAELVSSGRVPLPSRVFLANSNQKQNSLF